MTDVLLAADVGSVGLAIAAMLFGYAAVLFLKAARNVEGLVTELGPVRVASPQKILE